MMKSFKFALVGLMALIMTSLTSCLNGDSEDIGETYYISDFMNIVDKGKILTTDDNYSFTMENFTAFSQQFPNPTPRMFLHMSIFVEPGKTLDEVYATPLTPITVLGACPAGVFEVAPEKPAEASKYIFSSMDITATKHFLNCFVTTTVAKNPQREHFKAYVSGVASDGTIFIDFANCTPVADDNLTGAYGLSFPMADLLAGQELKLDSNGCVSLQVGGSLYKVKL